MDFVCNILANLFGSVIAGFVLYFFLEKRIKDATNLQAKRKAAKAVLAELKFILHVTSIINKHKSEYYQSNEIPHLDFPVLAIDNFLSEYLDELSEDDIQTILGYKGVLNTTNNYLYKMRNSKTRNKDREKTLNQSIPSIVTIIPKLQILVRKYQPKI
ncbi:hypothetical protein H3C66_02360 [Patescibacteria group bacterium]|nr:hypothetical protein [Patescibacteria group bacterium]